MQERRNKNTTNLLVVFLIIIVSLPSVLFAARKQRMSKREIREDGLVADYFFREGATRQKGLIVLGGAEGGKHASTRIAYLQDLVDMGFAVLSLAYFKDEGLPPSLQSIPLEYFMKATDWLIEQPETRNDGIILLGGSRGAEAALVYASYSRKVKGVIATVPSAYVFEGIPSRNGKQGIYSAWSYQGKDLPYVPFVSNDETWIKALRSGRLITVFREALADPEAKKRAAIAVEKIQGPILLVSARRDMVWPSYDMSQTLMERLRSKEFPHVYKHIVYDVEHNVYDEAKECWPIILKFMKEYCLSDQSSSTKPSEEKADQPKEK